MSVEVDIPGVLFKARVSVTRAGTYKLELLLRGDPVASAPLSSLTDATIEKALVNLINEVRIQHQVPPPIIKDVANKLAKNLGATAAIPTDMEAPTTVNNQIIELLNQILQKLEKMEERLEIIESKIL